jgi:hypothetical protein
MERQNHIADVLSRSEIEGGMLTHSYEDSKQNSQRDKTEKNRSSPSSPMNDDPKS